MRGGPPLGTISMDHTVQIPKWFYHRVRNTKKLNHLIHFKEPFLMMFRLKIFIKTSMIFTIIRMFCFSDLEIVIKPLGNTYMYIFSLSYTPRPLFVARQFTHQICCLIGAKCQCFWQEFFVNHSFSSSNNVVRFILQTRSFNFTKDT